jgi:16S rRNA (cytosine967-C5)-methyltransferase
VTAGAGAAAGTATRREAARVLTRIERDGAYANLVLPAALDRSGLDERDRAFVTDLVYGTTRMRRACDAAVEPYLLRAPDPEVRTWLRLGAYQLLFSEVPTHAAVSATVGAAPRRLRGLLNAVLRKVAGAAPHWPDDATRLSYPDWIVHRLTDDLGAAEALAALEAMNVRPEVHRRADGYVQDLASQWVAALVEARPGERILDAAAAPGGKATALAATGASVVAADVRPTRAALVARNAADLGHRRMAVVVADGTRPPFRAATFDRVLLDAPCSGLGTLHRRPDARWRVREEDVAVLARLQSALVEALLPLVRPGGWFVYSVCTLTRDETVALDEALAHRHPELVAEPPPPAPWAPLGRGALLLPQAAGTDGMYLLRLRVPADR